MSAVEEIPGVEDGRVVSASTLADAHHEIVVERSATRRGTITHSPLAPGEGRDTVYTKTQIDGDAFFYRVVPDHSETERAREEYIDGTDRYVAQYEDGEWTATQVGARGATSRTWLTGNSPLMGLTDAVRVVGTESRYGEQHYLFSRQVDGGSGAGGPTDSHRRGRYLLTEDGLCQELATVERTDDGASELNQIVEWSLSDVGNASVGEPEWTRQIV